MSEPMTETLEIGIYYEEIDGKIWIRHVDEDIDKFYILAQTNVKEPETITFTTA